MTDWHRVRLEAAARALAEAGDADDAERARAAVRAADDAVYGVVPREEFEALALDYSAMRVRALQDEDLLDRALDALDRIAATGPDAESRGLAFGVATEVRAMLDARRDQEV